MEFNIPDFVDMMIYELTLSELIHVSETNKKWSDEIRKNLNKISLIHGLPYAKTIKELALSTWISANQLLKNACKIGDMRMVKIALRKDAVTVRKASYYAAKYSHFDILEYLMTIENDASFIIPGLIKSRNIDKLISYALPLGMSQEECENMMKDDSMLDNVLYNELPPEYREFAENQVYKLERFMHRVRNSHLYTSIPMIKRSVSRFDDKIFTRLSEDVFDENRLNDYVQFQDKTEYGYILEAIQYTFAKFLPEEFETKEWEVILPRCILYCYKHNKSIDFMIQEYHKETERFIKIWHIYAALYYLRFDLLEKLGYTHNTLTISDAGYLAIQHPELMKFLRDKIDIKSIFYHTLACDRPKMMLYVLSETQGKYRRNDSAVKEQIFASNSLECWKLIEGNLKSKLSRLPSSLLFNKYLYEAGYFDENPHLSRAIAYFREDSETRLFLEEKLL